MPPRKEPPRAWQRMLSGRRLDLLDPSPLDVEIEDIAHGLARVARWNGQTRGPHIFSVAQHSVLVEHIAGHLDTNISAKTRAMVLLHDAPEYVIGDIEATHLAGFTFEEADKFFGRPDMSLRDIDHWLAPISSQQAEEIFLTRFRALEAEFADET